MARLSLGDNDQMVRDWFVNRVRVLGCTLKFDKMGNIFAIREGKNKARPPIFIGSHLDTQPMGGRYDGILGVNAGLEILRVLQENDIETEGPIGVVNWTNEEGARFPKMCTGSSVWSGDFPLESAWALEELTPSGDHSQRRTMKQELERIGYLGAREVSYLEMPFAAHFELHIEQGPILEREGRRIGVVDGVQAFRWFEVTVQGSGKHAGTTPFETRQDAMLCASKLIVHANVAAKRHGAVSTTGVVNVSPGSTNTIADLVTFTIDMRAPLDSQLDATEAECRASFETIAAQDSEKGCAVTWKALTKSPAVHFDKICIGAVQASAKELCGDEPAHNRGSSWKHMMSGAGHDSVYTSKRCPTSMVFVPSRDGISHNPEEWTSPEDW